MKQYDATISCTSAKSVLSLSCFDEPTTKPTTKTRPQKRVGKETLLIMVIMQLHE